MSNDPFNEFGEKTYELPPGIEEEMRKQLKETKRKFAETYELPPGIEEEMLKSDDAKLPVFTDIHVTETKYSKVSGRPAGYMKAKVEIMGKQEEVDNFCGALSNGAVFKIISENYNHEKEIVALKEAIAELKAEMKDPAASLRREVATFNLLED